VFVYALRLIAWERQGMSIVGQSVSWLDIMRIVFFDHGDSRALMSIGVEHVIEMKGCIRTICQNHHGRNVWLAIFRH